MQTYTKTADVDVTGRLADMCTSCGIR